jgi:hypothetical protein
VRGEANRSADVTRREPAPPRPRPAPNAPCRSAPDPRGTDGNTARPPAPG